MTTGIYKLKRITLFILFFAVSGILLIFTACERKKWKETVPVAFVFSSSGITGSSPASPGTWTINSGTIHIKHFSISGVRKQSDDISMEQSVPVEILLSEGTAKEEFAMNIPQGTYTKMTVSLTSGGDSSEPEIILKGLYMKKDTIVQQNFIPIQFESLTSQLYELPVKENDGTDEAVLVKDIPRKLTIQFDVNKWFENITGEMVENAELYLISGQKTILINNQFNSSIYDLIAQRISEGIYAQYQ